MAAYYMDINSKIINTYHFIRKHTSNLKYAELGNLSEWQVRILLFLLQHQNSEMSLSHYTA